MNEVCKRCHQAKWPGVHLKGEEWKRGECRICGEITQVCVCPPGEHDWGGVQRWAEEVARPALRKIGKEAISREPYMVRIAREAEAAYPGRRS